MARKPNRYQIMEHYMTYALLADTVLFVLYLVFAGLGITWLKVTLSIIAILLSLLILTYLYLTKELLRRRSLWMSVAAAAITVCILFSLILNFPSPKYEPAQQSPAASQPQDP